MQRPRSSALKGLAATASDLSVEFLRFLRAAARSRGSLVAENLFLRKQLAFYREHEVNCGLRALVLVAKSSREQFDTKRLRTFLAGPIMALPFEDDDAKTAGAIRADLEASGKPIGAYDLLIAGQALKRELTVVTANVSEFSRVRGLAWQDWVKP